MSPDPECGCTMNGDVLHGILSKSEQQDLINLATDVVALRCEGPLVAGANTILSLPRRALRALATLIFDDGGDRLGFAAVGALGTPKAQWRSFQFFSSRASYSSATMSSHRPYRPALGIELAPATIEHEKGTLFNPEAVDVCRSLVQEGLFRFESSPDR